MNGRILRIASVAIASAALAVQAAQPASAGTLYTAVWGAGSYHTSADYIPTAGTLKVGTYCNTSGEANYSYSAIVKTSSGQVNVTMPSYPCDSAWHNSSSFSTTASGGTAYYLRWYGQWDSNTDGASAASAGARMWR